MRECNANEESLFSAALALPPGERADFLAHACGDDSALRDRVAALLSAHEGPGATLGPRPVPTTADRDETIGSVIGRYRLLEKVGEGGFGVVYLAEQREPVKRRVALKIIKLGMDTRQVVARFEAERQALALMDHPNIAKVLDAGATETGRPYFVMELVRGIKITEYCDLNHLSTGERLDLFIAICHALQHAHQKGIIHRDLKPSNILVTLLDGVPVPKVIDFGIAKATQGELTDKTIYTQLQQCIGTPAYMSPEQVEMSGLDVDTRSDIYSLGVLLYELLTGGTPFDKEELAKAGWDEMRRTLREKDPLRPSTRLGRMPPANATELARRRGVDVPRLVALLRGDLDWIVMRCLEKDRTRRYETANGLAQDLTRHLHNEPVTAHPPSVAYRLQKMVRRNRLAVAAVAAVVLALVLGLVGTTWQAVRARQAEKEQIRLRLGAEANEKKAEAAEAKEAAARRQAQRQTYSAEVNLAHEAYVEGRVGRALTILKRHIPETGQTEDLRGFDWRYLWRLCQEGDALHTVRAQTSLVAALAFLANGTLVSSGLDGMVRIHDPGTQQELFSFRAEGKPSGSAEDVIRFLKARVPRRLAISANGRIVAACSEDGAIRIWRVGTDDRPEGIPNAGEVRRIVFTPDGSALAVSGADRIRVWNITERRDVQTIPAAGVGMVHGFSIDGRIMVGGRNLGAVLWSVSENQELVTTVTAHTSTVPAVVLSPDRRTVATASCDTTIKLWDAASGQLLSTLLGHRGQVWCLAFSPDNRMLASGSGDETVRLWDVSNPANPAAVRTLRGHTCDVASLTISADGSLLASGDAAGMVRVWPLRPGQNREVLEGQTHWVFAVAFSPTDNRLASAGFDGTIRLWDVAEGRGRILVPTRMYDYFNPEFSPDGKQLATGEGFWGGARKRPGAEPGTIRIWNVFDASEAFRLPIDKDIEARGERFLGALSPMEARAPAITSDGRLLACGNNAGWIQIWELPAMKRIASFQGHKGQIQGMQFSPNGRWLAAICGDGPTKVFATANWTEAASFADDPNIGWSCPIAFSPDSSLFAMGSRILRLWNVANWQPTRLPDGHNGPIMNIRFSPDGKTIATGSMDHSVKLWSRVTGQEVATLKGHTGPVSGLAFSADGTILASSSMDTTIRLWRAISPAAAAGLSR